MKPFENWNQKSLVLIGASLGAGVLLLLAAVPSQTDFDGTYFKTNSLPISLTGYLTNWAKLDTNASGGDTIWTTNADGVISPFGTGQLTNVLRFTSGLANNATNVAAIVNTATTWSDPSASLLTLQNNNTNRLRVSRFGGLEVGPNSASIAGYGATNGQALIALNDVSKGDGDKWEIYHGSFLNGDFASNNTYIDMYGQYDLAAIYMVATDSSGRVSEINHDIAPGDVGFSMFDEARKMLEFWPRSDANTTPYFFNTFTNRTANEIVRVQNNGTNKFTVVFDGSITTGGNTNRWIFGGVTNGAPDVNVDGVHYPLAVTDSPALTGTPTINGQSVETQLTNKLDKTQGGNVAGTVRLTGTTSLLSPSTMTTAQKNALTPQAGDMVYDSDLGRAQVYDGAAWHSRMRLDGDTSTTGAAFTLGSVILTNNPITTVPLQINATNGTTTNIAEINSGGTNYLKVLKDGTTVGIDGDGVNTLGFSFASNPHAGLRNSGGTIYVYNGASTLALGISNNNLDIRSPLISLITGTAIDSASGIVQFGADSSSAGKTETIKGSNGSGTDKNGGLLTLEAGDSTGTGIAGSLDLSTGLSAETSSSTLNAYSIRFHAKGKFVALTHATTNAIIKFSLPANKLRGGSITALCYATNSTPHLQALTSQIQFSAVAIGTTITGTISQVDNPLAADSGTLTCAYTLVDNGDNTFYISANPNSSLSSPTERCKLVVTAMSGNAATTITDY